MTTAAVEKKTGISRSTIYFYIRQGLLPEPQKTPGGRSLYSDDHVDLLRRIGELKRAGRSLAEIKRALNDEVARAQDNEVDLAAREYERMHSAIIEVATEEFATKGYRGTRVAAIIQRLSINPQLFYSHFPSKLHLLAECFKTLMAGSVEVIETDIAQYSDPAERELNRLASGFGRRDLGPMLSAAIRSEGRQDELEEYGVAETLGVIVGQVARELAELRPQGSPVPPVSDELVAYGLLGSHRYHKMRVSWGGGLTTADFLRAHLFHYLALTAAIRGEVDIYSRLAPYEELIQRLSARMPVIPPTFES